MRRNPHKLSAFRILAITLVALAATTISLQETLGQVDETVDTGDRPEGDTSTPITNQLPTSFPTKSISPVPFPTTPITQTSTITATHTNSPIASPTEKITQAPTTTSQPTETPVLIPSSTSSITQAATATDLHATTPTQTDTPVPSPTASMTQTSTATDQPISTSTDTPSPEPSSTTASFTLTPTSTNSPTSTSTVIPSPVPSATASFTQAPTATDSPTSTDTPSPVPSVTVFITQAPTATDTPTSTDTPSPVPSSTASFTPAPTDTYTPSSTYTDTPTPVPSATASFTPAPTDTDTPNSTSTYTPTPVPSSTASFTPAPTDTDTPNSTSTDTPTPVPSSTASFTIAPTSTDMPTSTDTPSPVPSSTASITQAPTATDTPTSTSTDTPTPVPSSTASFTPVPTDTYTPTSTSTDTPSPVPSATASFTIAPTATDTPTSTDTPSPVPSATASITQAPTTTDSPTSTSTKTSSPSPTLEPSPSPTNLPGSFPQWSKVEISFAGPDSVGMSDVANPFQVGMNVAFMGPSGQTFVVSAFYDGDGAGGLDGDVWKVRFSPDEAGNWSFSTSSSNPLLNGLTGSFDVTPPTGCQAYTPGSLPDFLCLGRLEYAGAHYLKFDDGPYWLKGGEDDPEDFLAPGVTVGFSTKEQAIEFLASKGINSLYMMLHNIDGDGNNVWPWVGSSAVEAKANHEHFNVAKLGEWEDLFSYLQEQGLVLHLVLEDDSAWTGFNRSIYYREMIARFGYHNGIIWNISEEYNENYSADQVKNFAQMIRDLDPYDHPITVHNAGGLSVWDPFVGDPRFDMTSFQTEATPQNAAAATWFETVESSGRPIPISFDETGKLGVGDRDLTRHIVWSIYLGGGNFEMHTYPLPGYVDFTNHFEDLTRARAFLESLPFWQMRPLNELLVSGQGYVFAMASDVFAIYLPYGGTIEVDLSGAGGNLQVVWFNPRTGEYSGLTTITGGGIQAFTPPFSGDAVLSITSE